MQGVHNLPKEQRKLCKHCDRKEVVMIALRRTVAEGV